MDYYVFLKTQEALLLVAPRSYRQIRVLDADKQVQYPNLVSVKPELASVLLQQFAFLPEMLLIQDVDANDDIALIYQGR